MPELGYYTLPVILSFDGVDKQVNSSLGKAFSGVGTKQGRELAKGVAAGVKAGEADVKRALDGYSKLYDKQKDAAGKLRAELDKLKDLQDRGVSGGRLTAQAEKAEKARRDEARAVREARDSYKEYESAAKSAANAGDKSGGGLLDKLKGASGAARSSGGEAATGFLEGFGGPIAALGTRAGPIGLALAAAAALSVGAGALIAKQVFAGMEQEQQRANVAAQLGLDPAAMKPIADASAKAYAGNFGESVAANMDAARIAIQTGLIGPDSGSGATQTMVQQLTTVSSILGEDIPATARAAQQAIRTGLAPNATAAFDLIVKGQQAGLNTSQDFLDTLNEYGTQFRKLGLSGPEAIGLISQAMKGGARDSDVAADAIKEFSIRAIDGSEATNGAFTQLGLNWQTIPQEFAAGGDRARNALQLVMDKIREVPDPVQKAAIQVALFGTQSEDLGNAINNMDLSTAVQQLGQVQGATQKAADTMGNTATGSVESAKRAFELGSASMQQSLAEAFGPLLKEGADFLVTHKDDIAGAFRWMAGGATEFGASVGVAVGSVIKVTALLVEAIGDTAGFVLDGFESMLGGAATVASAFGLDGLAGDLRTAKAELGVMSDQFHGWGEGLNSLSDGVLNTSLNLHNFDTSLASTQQSAQNAAAQVEHVKQAMGALPDGKQIDITAIVTFKDTTGLVISPDQLKTPAFIPAVPGETRPPPGGGRAYGGPIRGPGGSMSDVIPIWASNGEHMLSAKDVQAMGGQAGVYAFRNMLHRAGGGALDWLKLGSSGGGQDFKGPGVGNIGKRINSPLDPGKQFWGEWRPGMTLGPRYGINGRGKPIDLILPWWMFPGDKEDPGTPGRPNWKNHIGPLGFASGGAITPDVAAAMAMAGTPYSQGNRTDCSGMVARVIDRALGMPESGLMSTKTAAEWLQEHGFKPGRGGPGTIRVGWYDHGPGPNDGHMAMTLSDGTNAEAGGSHGNFLVGAGAQGADSPQFDQHMFLPTLFGEGPGTASSTSVDMSRATTSSGGGGVPGYGPNGEPGTYTTDQSAVADADARVKEADARVKEAEAKQRELEADAKESEKISAQADVDKAKADAEKARRDLDEAKKGTFSPTKDTAKGGKSGGGPQLSEIGGIASSFLKETFGLDGSWLPDIGNLMPLKMVDTLLGALIPSSSSEGSTSGSPFGIPDIAAPPMPPPGVHEGTGVQGPPPVQIDASQTVNGNIGWDPAEIERQRRQNVNRAIPRIPAGS